jgi:hypothetical protein
MTQAKKATLIRNFFWFFTGVACEKPEEITSTTLQKSGLHSLIT